jgi:hypothetical protein
MFALVALICFILALFKVAINNIDLVVLGLCFVALHLFWEIDVRERWRARGPR